MINEYIKNCPLEMLNIIVKFFNVVLITGIVPTDWCLGVIKPLYKNNGSADDSENYKGVTSLSCIGKLFTAVVNDRLTTQIEFVGMIGDEQAGFRECYSTLDPFLFLFSIYWLNGIFTRKKLYTVHVLITKRLLILSIGHP